MAFWGIELKPGRPYFHKYDTSKGRLHISQATLGLGDDTNKVTVECNVGYERPHFICSLFPKNMESVQLNIEYKEVKEVKFSVIGQRSVHLVGYYTNTYAGQSESYAEDSKEKKTETSDCSDNIDTLADDSVSSYGVVKKRKERGVRRKLYQCFESDEESGLKQDLNNANVVTVKDSEDEDEDGVGNFFTTNSLIKPLKSTNTSQEVEKQASITNKCIMRRSGLFNK